MKKIKQITLFFIVFIASLALCEIFIKAAHLTEVSFSEFYEDIGRGRRKNLNYLLFNEGFGIGHINKYRFLGEAISPKKGKNTIRVALLGDSFVESFQIFERDYFGTLAKNILEEKYPEKKFEFLNFGRSGFNIANMYAYQKLLVNKFDADFIFYMLSNENFEPKYLDPLNPKVIIKNNHLIVSFNFDPQEVRLFKNVKYFIQYSCISQMLSNANKRIANTTILSILLGKIYTCFVNKSKANTASSETEYDYQVNSLSSKIIESLNVSKIVIINRDSNRLAPKFIELCSKNHLKFFDLSQSLTSMEKNGNNPYEWKVTKKRGHWNQKAHKVIAKEIALLISNIANLENTDNGDATN